MQSRVKNNTLLLLVVYNIIYMMDFVCMESLKGQGTIALFTVGVVYSSIEFLVLMYVTCWKLYRELIFSPQILVFSKLHSRQYSAYNITREM